MYFLPLCELLENRLLKLGFGFVYLAMMSRTACVIGRSFSGSGSMADMLPSERAVLPPSMTIFSRTITVAPLSTAVAAATMPAPPGTGRRAAHEGSLPAGPRQAGRAVCSA